MNKSIPIAITGASGLLGRALLRSAEQNGIRVRALSRRQRIDSQGVEWIKGEITDEVALGTLVAGCGALVHAAATMQGGDEVVYRSIVAGTAAAATATTRAGIRLVHISSIAVVDPALTGAKRAIGDDPALDPRPADRGGYTRGKIEAERMVVAMQSEGLDTVIVRPAQLVGQELNSVPPSVGVALASCRAGIVGMSKPLPLVHVDDAAAAIMMVATQAERPPSLINLVDPLTVSRQTLLQRLRDDQVSGSQLAIIPLGPVVQPLARLLAPILPGAAGKAARRITTMESNATWRCDAAAMIGWSPENLERWLKAPGQEQPHRTR